MAAERLRHASEGNICAFSFSFTMFFSDICHTLSQQGSDYYNEVECSADGKGNAQVCRNTKYIKKGVAAGAAAVPQPDNQSGPADPVQLSDRLITGPEDDSSPPSTIDDVDEFYEEHGGEL